MTFYSASGFSEEQEQKILDAAKSLARLVRDSGAPVAFSIDKYAELVIGSTIEPVPQELEKLLKSSFDSNHDMVEVFMTEKQIKMLETHAKSVGDHASQITDFVCALDTAMSRDDVIEICNCVLAEYGYDHADHTQFEGAGGDDVFIVFPVTKQIKFLDL